MNDSAEDLLDIPVGSICEWDVGAPGPTYDLCLVTKNHGHNRLRVRFTVHGGEEWHESDQTFFTTGRYGRIHLLSPKRAATSYPELTDRYVLERERLGIAKPVESL
jgi:hypothetical protein